MKKWHLKLLFITLCAVSIYVYGKYYKQKLEKEGVYSIATIKEFYYHNKKIEMCRFSFMFQGKEIIASELMTCFEGKIKIGDRFYVKFVPNDPKYSTISYNAPVPNHIQNVPESGWEKRPPIDSTKIPQSYCK
ncbi:MAG: hypothetical protein MUC49_12900 [Raineya sp.]|jgi:hypothetical protein|nr:hypothetical protein [Raineya sp.]